MKTRINSKDYRDFLDNLDGYYQSQVQLPERDFIGERLKKTRELQGISLEKLAAKAGVDERFLREVENCKVFPDLGTIIKLSKALRVTAGFLIDETSGYSYSVVRKEDRKSIHRIPSGEKEHPTYTYQSLATGIEKRHMEAFLVTLSPGDDQKTSLHDGEEFIMVMEGEVAIRLGEKREILKEGDSIYYLSSIPHALKSNREGPAVVLAVLYAG